MNNLKLTAKLATLLLSILVISCNQYTDYSNIPFEEPNPKPWQEAN